MKGLLKVLIGLFGLLVVLIIAAAVIVPMYFDPNDYRDEISAMVKKQTGRDLQIEGELQISVFPWLGIQTGRIVLGNAEGFGNEPFAEAEEIQARVKLLPLLRKEIEMDTVVIDRLRANLIRNKDGVTNWDDLVKAQEEEVAQTDADIEAQKTTPADADQPPPIAALALGGLDIRDSRVSWTDNQAGKKYLIDKLNLKTGALVPGEPLDLEMSLAADLNDPELKGTLALNGTVAYDLANERYKLTPIEMEADFAGPGLPGGQTKLALTGDVEADMKAQTASLSDFSLKTLGTRIDGDLNASNLDRAVPSVNGELDIEGEDLPALMRLAGLDDMAAQIRSASSARFSLSAKLDADAEAGTAQVSNLQAQVLGVKLQGDVNATATQTDNPALSGQISLAGESLGDLLAVVGQAALAENLKSLNAEVKFSGTQQQFKLEPINATATFAGKQLPQGPVDIALIATATANMANETLSIPSLAVKGMGLDVQATVDAKAILSTPQYSGNLKVAAFNLRQLMQQLALDIPDTSDDKTLTKVAVDTQYAGTTNSINLSNLVLQLDETTAKGNFGIIDLARQAVRMNLTVDKINADRYLPPATEAPATPETAAAGAAGLPLETLRALDIQGTLAIGELIISKAKLSDIKLNLNAKDGDITLAPASANVYSGKYQGAVNLNAKKDTPLVNIDSALTGININALLSDLRGEPSKLSGTADLQAKLDARGADADAFKRTLGGNVAFVVNDGSFKGVNIGHMLRQAGAVLEGGSLQAVPKEESTDFSELTGTLNIKDGLINNDDLAMKSPAIRLDGKGTANLVSEQVDYVLNASVAKTAEGQGGRELKAVGGYTVPVRCKGTFTDPGCKPDLAGLAKARLQKELDKKSDGATKKVEEKLKEKLGDEVGEGLKNLLNF